MAGVRVTVRYRCRAPARVVLQLHCYREMVPEDPKDLSFMHLLESHRLLCC